MRRCPLTLDHDVDEPFVPVTKRVFLSVDLFLTAVDRRTDCEMLRFLWQENTTYYDWLCRTTPGSYCPHNFTPTLSDEDQVER
jgi:hypothetical protein